jgi:K+-transporting ATPase ATPase C chain
MGLKGEETMNDFALSLKHCILTQLVFCGCYTLAILTFAMVASPEGRQGSLIADESGTIRGSILIGQSFSEARYFWPRPSAVGYDASATGGSNLSPKNPEIAERARGILERLNLGEGKEVPADLVTASGSGVEPHITESSAFLQVPRVARARQLPEDRIRVLIDSSKDSPTLEILGSEPLVNVLMLNMALDGTEE